MYLREDTSARGGAEEMDKITVISVKDLCLKIKDFTILDHVSIECEQGKIYGLI